MFVCFFVLNLDQFHNLVWHSSADTSLAAVRDFLHTELSNRRLQSC